MTNRIGCHECRHVCTTEELLTAVNPFDDREVIHACPHCKSVEAHYNLCEVDGCPNKESMGIPIEGGYMQVCFDHQPPEFLMRKVL
jgi:Fe-S-cluster-containing hydrogenase component 2